VAFPVEVGAIVGEGVEDGEVGGLAEGEGIGQAKLMMGGAPTCRPLQFLIFPYDVHLCKCEERIEKIGQ
jgi:hypothetical protein